MICFCNKNVFGKWGKWGNFWDYWDVFLKFLWGGVDFLGDLGVLYNYCESIVSKVCNNGGDCLTGGGCRAGGSDTKTNIDSED